MNQSIDDSQLSDLRREVEALRERLVKMELEQARSKRRGRRFLPKPAFAVFLVSVGFLLFLGVLGAESDQQDALFISQSGNVGIGTTSPGFPLTFANTTGDKISFFGDSSSFYGFGVQPNILEIHTMDQNSKIVFGYGKAGSMTETMRVQGNGNVGIGTKDPKAKLDITGALNVSQTGTFQGLTVNGDINSGGINAGGNIKLGNDSSMYAPASPENLRILRGTVNANGEKGEGEGFTSSRDKKGEYRIAFTPPFSGTPSAVANQLGVAPDSKVWDTQLIGSVAKGSMTVFTGTYSSNRTDRPFSFIVMGPR